MPKESLMTQEKKAQYLKKFFYNYVPKKKADPGNSKGSALPVKYGGFLGELLYGEMKLVKDRAARLGDFELMLSTFMEAPCRHFTAWCTCDRPKLTFSGGSAKRAERLANDMLDRIGYWKPKVRGAFLYNGLFREEWIKVNIDWNQEFVGRLARSMTNRSYYQKLIDDFSNGLPIGNISRVFHKIGRASCRERV